MFIGQVGKRTEVTLKFLREEKIKHRYFYVFEDEAGRRVQWTVSRLVRFRRHEWYKVNATVADHYHNELTHKDWTLVTRVQVLEGRLGKMVRVS